MKKILAVAIATAFAAPAFAATSNVDIYGKLHMSLNWYDDIPTNKSDIGISSNASRIGFKGSEDLGGGLKGIWQIESTLNMDERNGNVADRNSFVGLSGGFGTALIGNHDTPLKLVGRKVDLFGDTIADSRNVMKVGSDDRARNVVAYISPNFSGFSGIAAYTTDFNGTSDTNPDRDDYSAWNVSGQYENGPIYVGFGYGDGDFHDTNGLDETWRLAGGFSFGDFRIVGQYDYQDAKSTLTGLGVNGDLDSWMIGGSFKMGAMVFKANYMEGDFDLGNVDPEQFTIGVDYNLSKRTSVYALYADGENILLGKGAGTSDQVQGAAPSRDVSALSFGVVHTF
jgi:predicted porin